jgi:predicted aldo/keto reductase-like oxidoreductase
VEERRDFLKAYLGARAVPVFRLGLSASYRPGVWAIRRAMDEGINYLFCFGFDTQMTRVIRHMSARERDRVVVATGGCNWIVARSSLRASLERQLRRLGTDYIDVFHYLGVLKPSHFDGRTRDELAELRTDPRVRAVAISCHDRRLSGSLATRGELDVVMVRYNAAHLGAEQDVLPFVGLHGTGVVAYTATRWGRLLVRPHRWPAADPVATAGQCYRFVLTDPRVDVVLTAPRSERELCEDLREVRRGPLDDDELRFMRRFGDCVHAHAGWFMGR